MKIKKNQIFSTKKTLRKSKSRKKSLCIFCFFFFNLSIPPIHRKSEKMAIPRRERGREGGRGGDQTVNNGTESWKGYGVYNLDCTVPVDRMWNHIWIILCLNIPSAVSFVIFFSIAKSMNNSTIENYDE